MSQRTIKFRAWDKKYKIMREWDWLLDKQCSVLNSKHFIPMLSTGLLDRNKKEIYEGDILRFKGRVDGNNREFILPVTFEIRGGFQMYLTGIRHYDIFSNEVEVIGNVFEDKNL